MSLKDMIAAQKEKREQEKLEAAKPVKSFKLNLGGNRGSGKPAESGEGGSIVNSDNSVESLNDTREPTSDLAGQPHSPNVTEPPSPSLTDMELNDINHEGQPDQFNEKTIKQFQAALRTVHEHVDDKGLIGDAVKNVLGMLEEHDFLSKIIQPADLGVMVRGLRENYGVVIAKKQVRTTKRRANAEEVEKVMNELADLDFDI